MGENTLRNLFKVSAVVVGLIVLFAGLHDLTNETLMERLQRINQQTHSPLQKLVEQKYFRLIRLNLNQECPLKMMGRMCREKSCGVCRCDDKDIPSFWDTTDKVISETKKLDVWGDQRDGSKLGSWTWHVEDEENDQGQYFDVHKNIESFTNYNGSYIWSMIYKENCFQKKDVPWGPNSEEANMCFEEKALYKIISGLHTSISSHLTRFYRNITIAPIWADLKNAETFSYHFNESEYKLRVLDHPDRVENLLMIYQIFVNTLQNIQGYLSNNFTIESDNIGEDLQATKLLQEVIKAIKGVSLYPFDLETAKFFSTSNPKVKEYQHFFHNISRIMNCVECEKCRLFGKMQTYGTGTAIKILLGYQHPYKRNQIVALINTFNKLSMSVQLYFRQRPPTVSLAEKDLFVSKLVLGLSATFLFFFSLVLKIQAALKTKFQKSFKNVSAAGKFGGEKTSRSRGSQKDQTNSGKILSKKQE